MEGGITITYVYRYVTYVQSTVHWKCGTNTVLHRQCPKVSSGVMRPTAHQAAHCKFVITNKSSVLRLCIVACKPYIMYIRSVQVAILCSRFCHMTHTTEGLYR
jgi:hypothetical protein